MATVDTTEGDKDSNLERGRGEGLVVVQPPQMKELSALLETLDKLVMRTGGESTGEDRSGDGGAGTVAAAAKGMAPRDRAIADLPAPEVMQRDLERYIRGEIRTLNREARRVARLTKPGAAHYLNELYAKIRRLNALIKEILEASADVLRRLFIRIFIDRQPIL